MACSHRINNHLIQVRIINRLCIVPFFPFYVSKALKARAEN